MTALVDVATYQWVTGDDVSPSGNVERALSDAQKLVEEHCRRTFEYGTYTETLDRFENGTVYPAATPIASVTTPTTTQLRFGGIYVGGTGDWPDVLTGLPAQVTVTYTGGYQPYGSGETPELPVKLMRVICRIAYLILHRSSLIAAGVPVGAKSASVGDVSVTGDLTGFVVLDASLRNDLRGFIRRTSVQRARSV